MSDITPMPSYENPPVIEVVCGVQFKPIKNFLSVHFGAYWDTIKKDYPLVEDIAPLDPILDPGIGGEPVPFSYQILNLPPLRREFFIATPQNRLIQLQNDRFHFNWRKIKNEDVYPRYSSVKKEFLQRWMEFNDFVKKQELGIIQPTQYELSYINHFLEGDIWISIADLKDIITHLHWSPRKDDFLPAPDTIGWALTFPCAECSGHLQVALKQGKRRTDGRGLFILELTVRGNPNEEVNPIAPWFDEARRWIVRGFTSLTSEAAHKHWRGIE